MPGDEEPTLRDRIIEALRALGCRDTVAGALSEAVMNIVAPELERRDERIAELEAEVQRLRQALSALLDQAEKKERQR